MATGEILAWEEMVGGTKAAPLDTSRTELPKVKRHLWTLVQSSQRLSPPCWMKVMQYFPSQDGKEIHWSID